MEDKKDIGLKNYYFKMVRVRCSIYFIIFPLPLSSEKSGAA